MSQPAALLRGISGSRGCGSRASPAAASCDVSLDCWPYDVFNVEVEMT